MSCSINNLMGSCSHQPAQHGWAPWHAQNVPCLLGGGWTPATAATTPLLFFFHFSHAVSTWTCSRIQQGLVPLCSGMPEPV